MRYGWTAEAKNEKREQRKERRLSNFVFRFSALVFALSSLAWGDSCIGHGGYARCSPEGYAVCEDGTVDKRSPCARGSKGPRVLKFKKRQDRGQVLKAGEAPPPTTLKESHRDLKN
jgi:hypothetical protein